MDFKMQYADKLISAEAAAAMVKNGDWVDYGFSTGVPSAIDKALAKRMPALSDVHFRGGILLETPEIFKIEDPGAHFEWNSWHMSAIDRRSQELGFGYYIPLRYSEVTKIYREELERINVAYMMVAPMDAHGYFNFGICASHFRAVCDNSDVVIVEVNRNMPRCLGGGDVSVHVSDIDYVVEGDNPPIRTQQGGEPTEVDVAIARQIVPQIPNGACLQLGIGGMPNVLGRLIADSDLHDLGVHTEMYVDSYVDMALNGQITGNRKATDRGLQVYAFSIGSQRLYDFLDDNPSCRGASVGYTNDVEIISQNDNVISINNAIDVDLYGQVNAETSGIRNISGAGGQLDFVLGAYKSRGGKSFICLSSTYTNKKTGQKESRIRPFMQPGSVATDTRANIQYLCTEYGCVNLKGRSTWQRAEAIIGLAHPDYREELIAEAEKMNIWRNSNRR